MIDPRLLRDDPDAIRDSLSRRLEARSRRSHHNRGEPPRCPPERRRASGKAKESGREIAGLEGEAKEKAISAVSDLAGQVKEAAWEVDRLESEFDLAILEVPNLVAPDAAEGFGEEDSKEIKRVGTAATEGLITPLWARCSGSSTPSAAPRSGSRFAYLKGKGPCWSSRWWWAGPPRGRGFLPMVPPVLVREEALVGTGFFPEAREQVYEIPRDELFLVGTAEVPLAAYHADEILDEGDLPLRYAGFSTCFRRESGTYGKDTAGIFRVHQFDKVEMFVFTTPDESPAEHDHLLGVEEELVGELEIPYRVVNVAAGDLVHRRPRSTTSRHGSPVSRRIGRSHRAPTPPISRPVVSR